MSIQAHFTHKKQLLVGYFTQVQQIVANLSLNVQLEVDREYFAAKNLLGSAPNPEIQKQCAAMGAGYGALLAHIGQQMAKHITNYTGVYLQQVSKADPKNASLTEGKGLNRYTIGRSMSVDVINHATCPNEMPEEDSKGAAGQKTIKNKKSNTRDQDLSGRKPVDLLNRVSKSRMSSAPKQERNAQSFLASTAKNPYAAEIESIIKKKAPNPITDYKSAQQARLSEPTQRKVANKVKFQYSEPQANNIAKNNQLVCEKLDIKIQQQAINLLHKVRPKRSPGRRGQMTQGNGQQRGNSSLLDISRQFVPMVKQSRAQH